MAEHAPFLFPATVRGFAAFFIATAAGDDLARRLKTAESSGRYSAEQVAAVRRALEEIAFAGRQWASWRASVDGRTEAVETEAVSESARDFYSPDDVASMLGVTASRVRQQLRAGTLRGQRIGRRWFVNRADALLRQAG